MFERPPSYRWREGNFCYLYGVKETFTVTSVERGYCTVGGVRLAQMYLQKQPTHPPTYRRSMREHSPYLALSGLEARRPQPWRVLEQKPTAHVRKWESYKKSYSRDDFLAFIRAVCPRVDVDQHYRIFYKDNPKRNVDDVVYLHGYKELRAVVRGVGNPGWYIVECALGMCTCHRSTLCTRGYGGTTPNHSATT